MTLSATKKTLAAAAATAAAAISLAACGGGSSSSTASATDAASTTAVAGKKIAFVGDVNVPVVNAVQCGMSQAARPAGVDFEYQVPDAFDPTKQIAVLNAVVATKPDVLIVSPDDPKALVAPLKQAAAEGIDIVLEAHELADDSFVSTVVKNDDYADGVLAAKLLAKAIGNRSGEVALLGYTKGGSTITDARQEGFEDQIKKYANLDFIGTTVLHSIELEEGSATANALMSAHPNLVGMAANSEEYSIGMAQAIAQRGLKGTIATVQMDATEKADKEMAEGTLDAASSPIWFDLGKEAMEQAIKVAAGEQVQKQAPPIQPIAVTPATLDSPEAKRAAMAPSGPC